MSFKELDFLLIVKEKGLDSAKSYLEDRIKTKLNKNQKQQLNEKINNINKDLNKQLKSCLRIWEKFLQKKPELGF